MSKRPENMHCADCRAPKPNWASCSLGTFICFNCSGLHRGLGTHLSFVRSVTLDEWTQKQANVMQLWGNAHANSFFEARMPPDFKKPDQHASVNVMNKFIRDKYERCKWAADDPAGDPRRGGKPAAAGGAAAAARRGLPRTRRDAQLEDRLHLGLGVAAVVDAVGLAQVVRQRRPDAVVEARRHHERDALPAPRGPRGLGVARVARARDDPVLLGLLDVPDAQAGAAEGCPPGGRVRRAVRRPVEGACTCACP